MREYDVFVDGQLVGTVLETNEDLARCAAQSRFDPPVGARLSVARAY